MFYQHIFYLETHCCLVGFLNSFYPGSKDGTCKMGEMWNLDYGLKKITTILPFVFPEWFLVCDEMP